MRHNAAKAKAGAGELLRGTMVGEFGTTGVAPLAATAGADWVLFDQEHTGWTTDHVRQLIVSARGAGVVPVVRPPALGYQQCAQLLDLGAMGILAPMVETVEQAELLVASCRYPPQGRRGATVLAGHDEYRPGNLAEGFASANEEVWTIALIESPAGVENVEAIAAVEGLDALWVGHLDLSSFMGVVGEFERPEFVAAIERVTAAAAANGKPVGIVVGSEADARTRLDQGFTMLLWGTDSSLYLQGLSAGLATLGALHEERAGA